MTFLGNLDFNEGRNPSQTTTIVLQRCLEAERMDIETFLKGLSIDPQAFFTRHKCRLAPATVHRPARFQGVAGCWLQRDGERHLGIGDGEARAPLGDLHHLVD